MSADFLVVNIKEMLAEEDGEHMLHLILSDFSCPINPDVERFLLYQSIGFAKRNQSVTYLVLEKKTKKLVAYFTLAIKPISVKTSLFSRTICKRIERVSVINEQTGEYNLAAYLIAQLGKNFKDGMNERISGERLLQSAIDEIHDLQFRAGGTVVFLEADDEPKLIAFYKKNGFKCFATRKRHGNNDQRKLVQLLKVI